MEAIYPYAHIIHLICAIIFLGFLFFDVVIFSPLKSVFGPEYERIRQIIISRAIKIVPICVLILFLSGGMMMSTWVGSHAGGFFNTPLQKVFMFKVFLALIIGIGVLISIACRIMGKKSPNFMSKFHIVALILGFIIVICAKIMFLV